MYQDGSDYVKVLVNGAYLEFSYLHAYPKQQSLSSGACSKGVLSRVVFNKTITGTTIVLSRQGGSVKNALFPYIHQRLQRVHVDSIDFDKRFLVYSSDQVEARYILSPSFMERMLKYVKKANYNVSFSFANNCMHMAMPFDKNVFGYSELDKKALFRGLNMQIKCFRFITDLVGDLKLNDEIYCSGNL